MKRVVLALICSAVFLPAQDLQNRSVLQVTIDLNDSWFVPVKSISNFRTQSLNNTNIFAGIGYRDKSWWAEGLMQKQWSQNGGLWSLDARFRRQFGRVSLYVEPSVILTPKTAFYEFVIVEERLWKGLSLRQETENVHRSGKDAIAVGGGLGYSLGRLQGCEFVTALVYRASPTGKNELRAYLNVTRRMRLHR